MRIKTHGKIFNGDYSIMSLADLAVEDFTPSTWTGDDGKETFRTNADGKNLYRVKDAKVLRMEDGKASGEVKNVSLQVLTVPAFPVELGGRYLLDGVVEVNHWYMNGKNGITITADKLIPFSNANPQPENK